MKCLYCNEDHPDDLAICPNTGKPLGQLVLGELDQGGQPALKAETEQTAEALQVPVGQDQALPDIPTAQISEGTATLTESDPHPSQIEPPATEATSSGFESNPTAEMPEAIPEVKIPERRRTFRWVTVGCVGIPLIILLLLALVVFVDPFNLHVWGRVTGRYDAAAEVMPTDTGIYVGINIANSLLTHVDRSVGPFLSAEQSEPSRTGMGYLSAPVDPKHAQQTNPLDDLLLQIEDYTGITIPEDISPWVGQYAGIGVAEFKDTTSGMQIPTGWVIAVEARNLNRADAFLATLQANMAELHGRSFESQTYKGVSIHAQKVANNPDSISFGRKGRMVIIASSLETLKAAIDRNTNQSLSTEEVYSSLIDLRPRDWSASLYINYAWVGSLLDTMMKDSMGAGTALINPYSSQNWTGILMNASAISNGLRFDLYMDSSGMAQSTDTNPSQIVFTPSEQIIQMLPQDTVVYMVSSRFDVMVQSLLSLALSGESDQGNFYQSFEETFGFSLQKDLINQLTGQWALYAVPSTRGLLPVQADLDLAVSLLAETDGDMDLKPITEGIKSNGAFSGITVSDQEQQGVTYYEIEALGLEDPVLAFGAGNGYFTLGTDMATLRVSPIEGDTLINATGYKAAIQALPANLQPIMYLDLENLFANIREGMDASERDSFNDGISLLEPVSVIAFSGRILQPNKFHTSIVVILADR